MRLHPAKMAEQIKDLFGVETLRNQETSWLDAGPNLPLERGKGKRLINWCICSFFVFRMNNSKRKRRTLISFDLMCSSNMNCEKTKNFFVRNWYVKLTVVFMMPVP